MNAAPGGPSDPALRSSQLQAIIHGGPYRRAIWDFDGVIADSEPLHSKAYELILARYGIHPPADFFREYVGQTETRIWTALRERYALKNDLDALRRERIQVYLEHAIRELQPNWFVRPLMDWLSESGSEQFIASSGNMEVVDALLDQWRLRPRVLGVFAAEAATGATYSKVAVLRSLISAAPRPVILFEDHEDYLREGAVLGATTVAVRHSMNDLPDGLGDLVLYGGAG